MCRQNVWKQRAKIIFAKHNLENCVITQYFFAQLEPVFMDITIILLNNGKRGQHFLDVKDDEY